MHTLSTLKQSKREKVKSFCLFKEIERVNRGRDEGRRGKDGNQYYDRFIERSVSFEIKTSTLDNPTTHALVRVL